MYKINPENFWREVWHDAPCRGPMKRLNEYVFLPEEGYSIRAWECMACGLKMYAGLDKDCRIITRPYSPEP